MTAIPQLLLSRTGDIEPATVSDDGTGLTLESNDGNIILVLENVGAGLATVTVTPTATAAGQALAPSTVAVPAGETWYAGPWPPVVFNDDVDDVAISVDVTSLNVSALGL